MAEYKMAADALPLQRVVEQRIENDPAGRVNPYGLYAILMKACLKLSGSG